MAKNNNITIENENSVDDFINTVEDVTKRNDGFKIIELMQEVTGLKAKMWGTAIVGFGSYRYKSDSGREGDAPLVAFSPRKSSFSLYLSGYDGKVQLLEKLGKYKQSGGCTHIVKLADVDTEVLKQLIDGAFEKAKTLHRN